MKIAIFGYGNLGRGVEAAAQQNPDVELTGIYTRRDPSTLHSQTGVPVYAAADLEKNKENIDVCIICGGSATDLPVITPKIAKIVSCVDSFDTHARIPEHFAAVDASAREGGNVALISCGWDPGLFSLSRVYANAILPEGKAETFWGRGVSQGHSDAIRRIEGVVDARQYTVPIESTLQQVRAGSTQTFTAREKHLRECYVVAAEGADRERIEREIKSMPNYFADYDTTVTFITAEEMKAKHSELPHGGIVIRNGVTGLQKEHHQTIEYQLSLDSNPEFTASVLVAYARAIHKMTLRGESGCKTVLDIAPADLCACSGEELRRKWL